MEYDVEIRILERDSKITLSRVSSVVAATLPTMEEAKALRDYLLLQAKHPHPQEAPPATE